MANIFLLDGVDLGVDADRSSVVITADSMLTAQIHAAAIPADSGEWALSAPTLYFRGVPLPTDSVDTELVVDEDLLDEYDIAFYFVEHSDVRGLLAIRADGSLTFHGMVIPSEPNP